MACCLNTGIEKNGEYSVLVESKAFQQARERTYLPWSSESHPCRMKMKEAGWFVVRNTAGELVAVCLYCKITCSGWTRQHDPFKVHESLSPDCVFVLYAHNTRIPTSPIIEFMPRRKRVRPSSHRMAPLFKRTISFEQWPSNSPRPSADDFAEAGLFYNGHNTTVECFFCHGQMSITRSDANLMLAHIDQCKYAKHLRDHSQRTPLNIQASKKVYELFVSEPVDNITFYFLRCIGAPTPAILLSALVFLPNEQELEYSDKMLKRLRPSEKLQQRVNWAASSDGLLVNILKDLAHTSIDLSSIPDDQSCSTEASSILSPDTRNDFARPCKTCLISDASPHVVSIICGHPGLCSKECFSKWMTCVTCGYTLGKAIRIYDA